MRRFFNLLFVGLAIMLACSAIAALLPEVLPQEWKSEITGITRDTYRGISQSEAADAAWRLYLKGYDIVAGADPERVWATIVEEGKAEELNDPFVVVFGQHPQDYSQALGISQLEAREMVCNFVADHGLLAVDKCPESFK